MKIKQLKIINQDQSTEIADIGADAVNIDYNDTNVKLKLDELSNNIDTNTANISNEITTRANSVASLQSQIRGLASGSPKGSYATTAALVSANPDTGVYIITADGHIYSWIKNASSAIDLGVYQATSYNNLINEITEELSEWQTIDATEIYDEAVWNTQNKNSVTRANSLYTKTLLPSGTTIIKASGKSVNAKWYFCLGAFYTIDNELISSFGNEDNTQYTDLEINVPENAYYVMINQADTKIANYKKLKTYTIVKNIGNNVNKIPKIELIANEAKEKINIVFDKDIKIDLHGYVRAYGPSNPTGYKIGTETQEAGALMSDFIEVFGYSKIWLDVTGNANWIWNIAYFDENKNFLPAISNRQGKQVGSLTIPDEAYYVIVSSWNSSTTFVPKAKLYNENSISQKIDNIEAELDNIVNIDNLLNNTEFSAFAKWGVIGDSLSVGHTAEKDGTVHNRNIYYSWPQYLARHLGNICLQFGRSGASAKTWMSPSEQYCYPRFIKEENLCQAYIIALGANDTSMTLGSIEDINFEDMSQNEDTEYGWYAKVINTVRTTAPQAPIFLFTLPYPRNTDEKITAINTMIRELASDSHFKDMCFVVDLDAKYNDYFSKGKMRNCIGNTGWHLTALGYLYASRVNNKAISEVMSANYASFQNIPFIPYGSNNVLD